MDMHCTIYPPQPRPRTNGSVTHVCQFEGEVWSPFEQGRYERVHAIKMADGSVWDCVNGWRS